MAFGGQTQAQKILAKDDDAISPVRDLGEYCKVHTEEAFNLFCNLCKRPVCARCLDKSHQGHEVVSLKSATDQLQKSLHQCITSAKDKKNEIAANTNDLHKQLQKTQKHEKDTGEKDQKKHKKTMEDIAQDYRKKLQEIERARDKRLEQEGKRYDSSCRETQKRFEDKRGKLQGGIQVENAKSMDIDNQIIHLQKASSDFSPDSAQDAVTKTRAALKKIRLFRMAPSIEEIKKKLPGLMKKLQADIKTSDEKAEDPVVITSQCLIDLQDFTSGKSDNFPGPLKGPNVTAVYKVDDIKVISEATARAAEDLLGAAVLPNYTRRGGYSVLTDENKKETHVSVGLKNALNFKVTWWWYLPADMKLGEAVETAQGHPVLSCGQKLVDESVMHKQTIIWWSTSDTKTIQIITNNPAFM